MKKLILDMDGVIVDFIGGIRKHHPTVPHPPTHWNYFRDVGIKDEDFYAPCNRAFWDTLSWTEDGKELLAAIGHIVGYSNIVICSSPVRTEGCIDGKRDWLRRELPEFVRNAVFTGNKTVMAGAGRVLIDDSDANVRDFRGAGGIAILVPRPWNVNARYPASEVVQYVADALSYFWSH